MGGAGIAEPTKGPPLGQTHGLRIGHWPCRFRTIRPVTAGRGIRECPCPWAMWGWPSWGPMARSVSACRATRPMIASARASPLWRSSIPGGTLHQ